MTRRGVVQAAPVYRTVVEGSLGAFGGIVIDNLDPSHPKPEVYIAGSSGIRRFDFH